MNVVHVFPYSVRVSGGHSNAIRSFIACQRATGVNALGVAPLPGDLKGETQCEFPLMEVDSLWSLRWQTLAKQFSIHPGSSLLHFHSVSSRLAPLMSELRQSGVPYVLTSHGQLSFRNLAHWLKKLFYLNCWNRSVRNAAGLHLLTELASHRLKYLLPGFKGRTLVQGNLVEMPSEITAARPARGEFRLPDDSFVLLFLGRLDVQTKGLDLLMKAFASLHSDRYRLVLAGPDWSGGRAELERLADRFNCWNRVLFPGAVYGAQKSDLLRMADAFVSPSRHEAYGISVIEAMLAGLPLVVSDRLDLAADLRAADAATVVPLSPAQIARAIARLEADPVFAQTLGSRGMTWATMNCNPQRAGERFRDFYRTIQESPLVRPSASRVVVGSA